MGAFEDPRNGVRNSAAVITRIIAGLPALGAEATKAETVNVGSPLPRLERHFCSAMHLVCRDSSQSWSPSQALQGSVLVVPTDPSKLAS